MTKMRRSCAPLIGSLLLTLTLSCGGEDVPTNRNPPEAGVVVDDAGGGGDDAGPTCPDNQPKVGETCGPGITESISCDFEVDECTAPNGMVYTEHLTYCCPQGVWEICGGTSPCDFDAAPPPDLDAAISDGPAGDANGDARDGGVDAP